MEMLTKSNMTYQLPDLELELQDRIKLLAKAKNNPTLQKVEIELCKQGILHFFRHYLYTDKNTNLFTSDEASIIPFIPFPFQEELVTELWNSILNGTRSIQDRDDLTNVFIEKSRQMGVSWIIVALFVYGFIFHNHKYLMISQKEEDVDLKGNMKSLFEKARFIIRNLPDWMLPKGLEKQTGTDHNKYKAITREDGSGSITGESANPNASRGGTYQAIFLDEMGFMSNAATINTAAAAATPCRIFNSTPNGEGNEFYRMRKLTQWRKDDEGNDLPPEIKGLRYHWSEHPLYTQEWYEWKIKGMTPEKIAQELEIDYNTAIIGRVYPEFPKESQVLNYDMNKPLYVSMDNSHGGSDPNAILIIQPDGVYWNVLDAIEINATPEQCAEFLTCQPKFTMTTQQEKFLDRYRQYNWRKAIFISDPYDTKSALGNSTILDDYKKVGINLMLPQERKKVEQILKTRTNMYRLRYSEHCLDFASAIMNAKYPERKEDSNAVKPNLLPIHNWTSHYRTALEYFVTYLLENPLVQKKKVVQDTRPYRDKVTGRLIYPKVSFTNT